MVSALEASAGSEKSKVFRITSPW